MSNRQSVFNQYCENLLAQYRRRNTTATMRDVNGPCSVLRQEDGGAAQTVQSRPVRRRTYVNGLSDADMLPNRQPDNDRGNEQRDGL